MRQISRLARQFRSIIIRWKLVGTASIGGG